MFVSLFWVPRSAGGLPLALSFSLSLSLKFPSSSSFLGSYSSSSSSSFSSSSSPSTLTCIHRRGGVTCVALSLLSSITTTRIPMRASEGGSNSLERAPYNQNIKLSLRLKKKKKKKLVPKAKKQQVEKKIFLSFFLLGWRRGFSSSSSSSSSWLIEFRHLSSRTRVPPSHLPTRT